MSDSLVLFEPDKNNNQLEQLDLREGLVEVSRTANADVKIPVRNHTKHDIILPPRAAIGSIQPIARVVETNSTVEQKPSVKVNIITDSPTAGRPPTALWHPKVDISHLEREQKEIVKRMLCEESTAFAQDDVILGVYPAYECQSAYTTVPKQLYKGVKEYRMSKTYWLRVGLSKQSHPTLHELYVYVRRTGHFDYV